MKHVSEKLAHASGTRAQDLNIALAREIAQAENTDAIKELIAGLSQQSKAVRHDCIKVLYETAAIKPSLLSTHAGTFIALLTDRDNRMQWGAMTALSALAAEIPDILFHHLAAVLQVAGEGSVITKDHAVKILVALSGHQKYRDTTIPLLLEQLLNAANNQLPSYAEQALPVVGEDHKERFREILTIRLPDVTPESKRKRVEKVLKKIR